MLKTFEKQSNTGVLIFAFDSEIKYTKIATTNAKLIKKYLDLPVTLVTDSKINDPIFDNIVNVENKFSNRRVFKWHNGVQTVNWKNFGRFDAYNLSPYENTILLDADFIILSDKLLDIISANIEITAFDNAYDISGKNTFSNDYFINHNSLRMYWATVIFFRKTVFVKQVFDLWKKISVDWQYYKKLYNISSQTYRNDFAFTIALNTLQGQVDNFTSMPYDLPTLNSTHCIDYISDSGEIYFSYPTHVNGVIRYKQSMYQGDLHIMNKTDFDKVYEFAKKVTV